MQESFSIMENWDRASSKTAVIWTISHDITNIPHCVKSMVKTTKMEDGKQSNNTIHTNVFLYLFLLTSGIGHHVWISVYSQTIWKNS